MKRIKLLTLALLSAAVAVILSASSLTVTVPPGGPVFVELTSADGTLPMTYQWTKNGVNIPGATGTITVAATVDAPQAKYQISANVVAADAAVYAVVLTNPAGSATSDNATLGVTVVSPPTRGTTAFSQQ
jgi:hypothetical protein